MKTPTTAVEQYRHEKRRRERRDDARMADAKVAFARYLDQERERTKGGRPCMPSKRFGAKAPNNRKVQK